MCSGSGASPLHGNLACLGGVAICLALPGLGAFGLGILGLVSGICMLQAAGDKSETFANSHCNLKCGAISEGILLTVFLIMLIVLGILWKQTSDKVEEATSGQTCTIINGAQVCRQNPNADEFNDAAQSAMATLFLFAMTIVGIQFLWHCACAYFLYAALQQYAPEDPNKAAAAQPQQVVMMVQQPAVQQPPQMAQPVGVAQAV